MFCCLDGKPTGGGGGGWGRGRPKQEGICLSPDPPPSCARSRPVKKKLLRKPAILLSDACFLQLPVECLLLHKGRSRCSKENPSCLIAVPQNFFDKLIAARKERACTGDVFLKTLAVNAAHVLNMNACHRLRPTHPLRVLVRIHTRT